MASIKHTSISAILHFGESHLIYTTFSKYNFTNSELSTVWG